MRKGTYTNLSEKNMYDKLKKIKKEVLDLEIKLEKETNPVKKRDYIVQRNDVINAALALTNKAKFTSLAPVRPWELMIKREFTAICVAINFLEKTQEVQEREQQAN